MRHPLSRRSRLPPQHLSAASKLPAMRRVSVQQGEAELFCRTVSFTFALTALATQYGLLNNVHLTWEMDRGGGCRAHRHHHDFPVGSSGARVFFTPQLFRLRDELESNLLRRRKTRLPSESGCIPVTNRSRRLRLRDIGVDLLPVGSSGSFRWHFPALSPIVI